MDDLINKLSAELKPVKKLPPIKWRLLLFIVSQIILVPLVMKTYSSLSLEDFNWGQLQSNPFFLTQILLMLTTWISTITVALLSTIPGRYKSEFNYIPIISTILLVLSILANYLSLDNVVHDHRSTCLVEISFLGLIPFFFMLRMLKKGFFISENISLLLGSFSSALLPTIIMHFTCNTHPTHVFVFHFLPLFLFSFLIPKIYLRLRR